MGLSCSCGDFDKSELDHWYEPGRRSIPSAGTRCCECDALLPPEPCATILLGDVYEPDAERPPHPEDVLDDEPEDVTLARLWAQRHDAMEDELSAFDREHGWDSETERFERYTTEYRCERCGGLAEAIEDLGYCMILPGALAEAHCEYVEQSGGAEMIWKRGRDGIWHPRRMTRADFAKREARRRWNRTRGFIWYGGWRTWLRYTVWAAIERRTSDPVMRALGYHRIYDHGVNRMLWHHGPNEPGMHWVRRQIASCGYTQQYDGTTKSWRWRHRDDGDATRKREAA